MRISCIFPDVDSFDGNGHELGDVMRRIESGSVNAIHIERTPPCNQCAIEAGLAVAVRCGNSPRMKHPSRGQPSARYSDGLDAPSGADKLMVSDRSEW